MLLVLLNAYAYILLIYVLLNDIVLVPGTDALHDDATFSISISTKQVCDLTNLVFFRTLRTSLLDIRYLSHTKVESRISTLYTLWFEVGYDATFI